MCLDCMYQSYRMAMDCKMIYAGNLVLPAYLEDTSYSYIPIK